MEEEFEKICILLASDDPNNAKIALQILKSKPELDLKVKTHFKPVLESSKRKKMTALHAIIQNLKLGKGTKKARLQIGKIPQIHAVIEKLHLIGEGLEVVPEWISQLTNLKSLVLTDSKLKVLPDWIGNLHTLEFLSIAGNQIQEIPASIGGLVNLECCYLIENQIKILPDSMTNLKSLSTLYVKKKNPITRTEMERIKKLLPNCSIV